MRSLFLLALTVAQLASAILLTSPAGGATLHEGETTTITWTSVNTDPTFFNILLVNFVDYPPFSVRVAFNVSTSLGSTKVVVPCDLVSTNGFQL